MNSGVGRMNYREKGIPYKVEVLLEEMKYCRVHASVVYSNVARDYAFTKGNEELAENVKASKRLYGVATVIPDIRYELEEGHRYFDWLLEQGTKGFKLYPKKLTVQTRQTIYWISVKSILVLKGCFLAPITRTGSWVACKNAAGFFNIDIHEIRTYGENECLLDEIALKVDRGEPLDNIPVIDAHAHMVNGRHATVSLVPMLNGDEDSIIHRMDRLGIDRIITSPWEGIMTNGTAANETSLAARRKYGERIEAYATCNPNYPEDLEKVVGIYHERHKFIGIKPYWPQHKYDLLGDKYNEWFEYGNKNRLIMLVHSGTKEIAQKVEKLSEMYGNMTFLLAHSGASYEVADYNIEVVKKRDNVFLEITLTSMTNGIIEYMVDEVGADRVLFGTDLPMRDPAPQLAWVAYARISADDKKKILGGNILKLIERAYSSQ